MPVVKLTKSETGWWQARLQWDDETELETEGKAIWTALRRMTEEVERWALAEPEVVRTDVTRD